MWVSPAPEKLSPPTPAGRPQPPATYRVEMGLTAHGLRNVGDVTAVRCALLSPAPLGAAVVRDAPLLRLDWEGYAITAADELYHTVWDNDEGTYEVNSPVSGVLREIKGFDKCSSSLEKEGIDETDVLAVVVSKREELERAVSGWVGEEEYEKILAEDKAEDEEGKRKFTTKEGGWSG